MKKFKTTADTFSGLDRPYSVSNLSSSDGMQAAVHRLSQLATSQQAFLSELRQIAQTPEILALIFSNNYEKLHIYLEREVLDSLPVDRGVYIPSDPQTYVSSFAKDFLSSISSYFSTLAPPSGTDPHQYQDHNYAIPRVNLAIEAVILIAKQDKASGNFSWDAARQACDELEIKYPELEEEAETLLTDLVLSLRRSAEFYIQVLGNQDMARRIRESVFRVVEAPDSDMIPTKPPTKAVPIEEEAPQPPAELDETQNAPSTVQPERAQQYFENAPDDFGAWHIFISSACVAQLRTFLRADKKIFHVIRKKIIELSRGFFSDSNHKRLVGGTDDLPILEAKMTGDLRLVYRIDLWTDHELKHDKQCILIFGVFTHAQFDHRLWDRVARTIPQSNREYRRRCNFRVTPRGPGMNVTDPMSWPHDDAVTEVNPTSFTTFSDDEYLQLHKLLSLEKFIPISTAVMRSILEDKDASYLFKVSPMENKIIHHPSSCFVIGRSGTGETLLAHVITRLAEPTIQTRFVLEGKTTTMLFKLLGVEKAKAEANQPIRQVFLTQSHILAQRVQEYYSQLYGAATLGVGDGGPSAVDSMSLFQLDEQSDSRSDLPASFSELRDDHFPLFVTFNQIRKMLEKDLGLDFSRHRSTLRSAATAGKVASRDFPADDPRGITDLLEEGDVSEVAKARQRLPPTTSQTFVTFDSFVNHYWNRLDQRLTAKLDPALVYSEIMGVICGSEATINSLEGHLDRNTYLGLSHRAFSTFANERMRVYDLFEKYKVLKLQNSAYDGPDRSHAILRKLHDDLRKIDFLYVDECQDFLIVDIKLLRRLCTNPMGLFWGGDTAQTISLGSTFRFQDLKALLYRDENEERVVKAGLREAVQPETFELLVNYRSHGGIVDCAGSIVSLISQLFPYSIDELKPERAVVAGPKPCVFRGWEGDVVHFEQFLFGGESARGDFGARQVILVRNDEVREQLRTQLGDAGLILTLLESKGLEFDDVLMYGFFEHSPATFNQWRVVLSVMESEESAPKLHELKHAIINTELKNLYVGITRARHHCWLWDSSQQGEPMVKYWLSKGLVKVQGPGDPIPQLATSSSPEEWYATGRELFQRKLYAQAASCFEKAHRPQDRDVATAYQKQKDAEKHSNPARRRDAFKAAGDAFSLCGDQAGKDGRPHHMRAMQCYVEAGEEELAVRAHAKSVDETEAAQLLARNGQFDEALHLVRPTKGLSRVTPEVAKDIIEQAKVAWLKEGRYKDVGALFKNVQEELEFIRRHGFRTAHKVVLKDAGRPDDAGELHKYDGEFKEAAQAFLTSKASGSKIRAALSLLDGLWAQCFGQEMTSNAKDLLRELLLLGTSGFKDEIKDQITMFKAISASADEAQTLIDLGTKHASRDIAIVILCYDAVLRVPPQLHGSSPNQMSSRLSVIAVFVNSAIETLVNPLKSNELRRLLGFGTALDLVTMQPMPDLFRVFNGSALMKRFDTSKAKNLVISRVSSYIVVSGEHLVAAIQLLLETRVRTVISSVHSSMIRAPLRPCLDIILDPGVCLRQGQDTNGCEYNHEKDLSVAGARQRLQIHLQTVFVLDAMHRVSWPATNTTWPRETRRKWIGLVYSATYPISHQLGNDQILPSKHIRNIATMLETFRSWLERFVEELDPTSDDEATAKTFLSDVVLAAMLARRESDLEMYSIFRSSAKLFAMRPDLVAKDTDTTIVNSVIKFYGREGDDALILAVKFFQHVNLHLVTMDVNVLVHFMEHVALAIMTNERLALRREVFHDLLLPRSWILYAIRHQQKVPMEQPEPSDMITPMGALIARICHWNGSASDILYDGKISPRSWAPKYALLFRIYRMLVLLGINTWKTPSERLQIQNAFAFAKLPENALFTSFVESKNWDQLTSALYYSMPLCEVDHLVLLEARARVTNHTLPNVARVTWLRLNDIEEQLSFDSPPLRLVAARPPQHSTSVPSSPKNGPPDANLTPKPPSSKNKKKKKKKQPKPAAAVSGGYIPSNVFPSGILRATPPASQVRPPAATAKYNVVQEDSDDSDEPPPLLRGSKKASQPKGVADESDDSDSMPPLIPAPQHPGNASAEPPKPPKRSHRAPEVNTPSIDFYGPGSARLFEALGKNPNIIDSFMKTNPGVAEASGYRSSAAEMSESSDDESQPPPDKFQSKPKFEELDDDDSGEPDEHMSPKPTKQTQLPKPTAPASTLRGAASSSASKAPNKLSRAERFKRAIACEESKPVSGPASPALVTSEKLSHQTPHLEPKKQTRPPPKLAPPREDSDSDEPPPLVNLKRLG